MSANKMTDQIRDLIETAAKDAGYAVHQAKTAPAGTPGAARDPEIDALRIYVSALSRAVVVLAGEFDKLS